MKALVTPKGLLGSVTCHSYTLAQSKYLHLAATVVYLRAQAAARHHLCTMSERKASSEINKGRVHFQNGL